jgi:hypothetical protein
MALLAAFIMIEICIIFLGMSSTIIVYESKYRKYTNFIQPMFSTIAFISLLIYISYLLF